MELKSMLFILLLVAIIFGSIGLIVADFRTYYPETGVPEASWETKFNYIFSTQGVSGMENTTNQSIFSIQKRIQIIGEADSFWEKTTGAFFIIFMGIFDAVKLVALAPAYIIYMVTDIGVNVLGIPQPIMMVFNVAIVAVLVFTVIAFLHRHPT